MPSLQTFPCLLEEEETYEPPEDPDSGPFREVLVFYNDLTMSFTGLSLEELGLRALQHIPRERAINGIHAFNEMR